MPIKDKIIATVFVRGISPTGEESIFSLGLTTPVEVSDLEWSCYVTNPSTKELTEISGNDGVQAISIALNYLGNRMMDLEKAGWKWKMENGNDDFPIDAYFFIDSWHQKIKERNRHCEDNS